MRRCLSDTNLWRDDGEVLLSRRPLVEVIHVPWLFHHVACSVVEVSISLCFFQHLKSNKVHENDPDVSVSATLLLL